MQSLLLVAILALARLISFVSGGSCTTYTTQSTCVANALCTWFVPGGSQANYCGCASTTPIDTVFVMDSSGSVTSSGWTNERNFVSSLLNTGLSSLSRGAIVVFSSGSSINYNFGSLSKSAMANAVLSLSYLAQNTWMSSGITSALTALNSARPAGSCSTCAERIIFLITDGNPYPTYYNPCSSTHNQRPKCDAAGALVVIVTVGPNINANIISCLVDDMSKQVISAASFNPNDLNSIRQLTDTFICPDNVNVQITEVRTEGEAVQAAGRTVEFVEFLNRGSNVDFEKNPLKFTGMFTATITKALLPAGWATGKYLVIFDPTTGYPDCYNCGCTDGITYWTGKQCSTAIFLECTSSWGCSWKATYNSATITKTNFGVQVVDGNDNSVMREARYQSGWPNILSYFTYENINVAGDPLIGTNWVQSCWWQGTPGQDRLSPCTKTCDILTCQSGGNTAAGCSQSPD